MKGQSVVTRGPVQNKSYFEVSELFHCHLPLLTYYDDRVSHCCFTIPSFVFCNCSALDLSSPVNLSLEEIANSV